MTGLHRYPANPIIALGDKVFAKGSDGFAARDWSVGGPLSVPALPCAVGTTTCCGKRVVLIP